MGKRRTRYVSQLEAQKHKTDHKEIEGTGKEYIWQLLKWNADGIEVNDIMAYKS